MLLSADVLDEPDEPATVAPATLAGISPAQWESACFGFSCALRMVRAGHDARSRYVRHGSRRALRDTLALMAPRVDDHEQAVERPVILVHVEPPG